MSTYAMRLHGVQVEPYFQRYLDTRPLAPVRGELFTRPDTPASTEEFFADLDVDEQAEVLDWLLDVASSIHEASGIESSINVTPAIVNTERGRHDFLYLAASTQVPITFEFTELPPEWTDAEANRLLTHIRERGHTSALDNFVADEASLASLGRLQFDAIKIAGDVSSGFDDEDSRTLFERTYQAITDAGVQHVVQGVEAQSSFAWLKDCGYTTFQGYWFGIPTPALQLTTRR